MTAFARMDGVWRGPAWSITPARRHDIIQTERIGPFLGGTIRWSRGAAIMRTAAVGFNAFGVISFNPATGAYTFSSWAQGQSGVFPIRPTDNGYVWEIPAGPGAIIRYTATIEGDAFREIGDRIVEGQPPMQIFEMNLRRVRTATGRAAARCPCASSLRRKPCMVPPGDSAGAPAEGGDE